MTAIETRERDGIAEPTSVTGGLERADDERVNWRSSIPFFIAHLLPLMVIYTGITRTAALLFVATYVVRMVAITAGYHRYFSHKTYKLGRFSQFVLAFICTSAAQKGPLWWAGHHRNHHRYSDTDRDIHSPRKGFWWAQVGWILCDKHGATPYDDIKDFARYPEIRFLNKHDWIGPWSLGFACYFIGGWSGLFFGFFASTVLLWHMTFFVNSLAHVFGRRSYDTADTSRNSMIIALITSGEGWHNNHHRYQSSARQGFRWWQIDFTYYVLKAFSLVGIVKDLRPVPDRILAEARPGRGTKEIVVAKPGGTFDPQ